MSGVTHIVGSNVFQEKKKIGLFAVYPRFVCGRTLQAKLHEVHYELDGEVLCCRITLGELDKWHPPASLRSPSCAARKMGLASRPCCACPIGFGANSHLHTAKNSPAQRNLPCLIEIVQEDTYQCIPSRNRQNVAIGLVTLEKVRVIRYSGNRAEQNECGKRSLPSIPRKRRDVLIDVLRANFQMEIGCG